MACFNCYYKSVFLIVVFEELDNCKKRILACRIIKQKEYHGTIQTHLSFVATETEKCYEHLLNKGEPIPTNQWSANCCVVANQTSMLCAPSIIITSSSRSTPQNQNFPTNTMISPRQLHQHIISLAKFPTTIILASKIALWSIATMAVNSPKLDECHRRCKYSMHQRM